VLDFPVCVRDCDHPDLKFSSVGNKKDEVNTMANQIVYLDAQPVIKIAWDNDRVRAVLKK